MACPQSVFVKFLLEEFLPVFLFLILSSVVVTVMEGGVGNVLF